MTTGFLGERICPSLWQLLATHDVRIEWLIYSNDNVLVRYDTHSVDDLMRIMKNRTEPVRCMHSLNSDDKVRDSFRSGATCPVSCDGIRMEKIGSALLHLKELSSKKKLLVDVPFFDIAKELIQACTSL